MNFVDYFKENKCWICQGKCQKWTKCFVSLGNFKKKKKNLRCFFSNIYFWIQITRILLIRVLCNEIIENKLVNIFFFCSFLASRKNEFQIFKFSKKQKKNKENKWFNVKFFFKKKTRKVMFKKIFSKQKFGLWRGMRFWKKKKKNANIE